VPAKPAEGSLPMNGEVAAQPPEGRGTG